MNTLDIFDQSDSNYGCDPFSFLASLDDFGIEQSDYTLQQEDFAPPFYPEQNQGDVDHANEENTGPTINPSPSEEEEIMDMSSEGVDEQSGSLTKASYGKKRTSNNSLKPVFTCMKRILLKLDNFCSGFFGKVLPKNQNSVKKQYFQWPISYTEFHTVYYKGKSVSIRDFLQMHRPEFERLAEKQNQKGTAEDIQRAKETQQFVGIFFKALDCEDYKERMEILFKGRRHNISKLEEKRAEFKVLKKK